MKKILSVLLILVCFRAFSQTGNDTTKYLNYTKQYGQRLARVQADTVLGFPKDTIYSKFGLAIKNGTLYFGNGTRWTSVGASAGVFYDSTLMASSKRLSDSSANKLRAVFRRNDSVFAIIGTSSVYQFRDSTGGGSVNTSVGGGYRMIVVGGNQVKTLTMGAFIKYDTSIAGTVNIIVDSAAVISWLNLNHPVKIKLDPLTLDTLVDGSITVIGGGSGSVAAFYPSVTAMLAASRPADSALVQCTGFNTPGDAPPIYYQWFASSTTTADNMTIFGTGTGRYKLAVQNNLVTTTQLGIFGSGDNTTKLQAAINYVQSNKYTLKWMQIYSHGALAISSNCNIQGITPDISGSIALTNGTTQSTRLFYRDSAAGRANNITIEHFSFNGQQSYSGGTFAGGSVNEDSLQNCVWLFGVDTFKINDVKFLNAHNGVFLQDASQGKIWNWSTSNLGQSAVYNFYDPRTHDIDIAYFAGHTFGVYEQYDLGGPAHGANIAPRRNGQDLITMGGYNQSVHDGEVWNDALTLWFWNESRWTKNAKVYNMKLHGYGLASMGATLGGYANSGVFCDGLEIHDIVMDSVYAAPFRARDSISTKLKYYSALMEIDYAKNAKFYNNTIMNITTEFRPFNNIDVHDNIFQADSIKDRSTNSKYILSLGGMTGAGSTDSSFTANSYNNTMIVGDAIPYKLGNAEVLKNVYLNTKSMKFLLSHDLGFIGEFFAPNSGRAHTGITISGDTYTGDPTLYTGFYIYQNANGPSIANYAFKGNDYTKTNLTKSNIYQNIGGFTFSFLKQNNRYSDGSTDVNLSVNGTPFNDITGDVTVSGGGGLSPIAARTQLGNPTGSSATPIAINYPEFDISDYSAVGDSSTDCTTAIQNLIYGLKAAGKKRVAIRIPQGVFKVTAPINIPADMIITWHGMGSSHDLTTYSLSRIISASTTNDVFKDSSRGSTYEHFDIERVGSGTCTAGAGIHFAKDGLGQVLNMGIIGFYDGVRSDYNENQVYRNTTFRNAVHASIFSQNLANPDNGDAIIEGCYFLNHLVPTIAHIWNVGSGGNKISNCKFNAGGTFFQDGIRYEVGAGIITSDLSMSNNSIENFTGWGVNVIVTGGGLFQNININGGNIAPNQGGHGIRLYNDGSSTLQFASISNVTINNGDTGVFAKNVHELHIGTYSNTATLPLYNSNSDLYYDRDVVTSSRDGLAPASLPGTLTNINTKLSNIDTAFNPGGSGGLGATQVFDQFNSANTTDINGRTPSPNTLGNWTYAVATGGTRYGINANHFYASTLGAGSGAIVVQGVTGGVYDLAAIVVDTTLSAQADLIGNYVDATNYVLMGLKGGVITTKIAGAYTDIFAGSGATHPGDTMHLRIVGGTAYAYRNSSLLGSATFNNTTLNGTKVGVEYYSNTSTVLDDFKQQLLSGTAPGYQITSDTTYFGGRGTPNSPLTFKGSLGGTPGLNAVTGVDSTSTHNITIRNNISLGIVNGISKGFSAGVLNGTTFPYYALYEPSAGTNAKKWDHFANGNVLSHRLLNDAENAALNWLTVTRVGIDTAKVAFPGGPVSMAGALTFNGSQVGNQGYIGTDGSGSFFGIWGGTHARTTSNYAFLWDDGGNNSLFNAPTGGGIYFRINNSTTPQIALTSSGPSFTLGSDATGDLYYRNSSGFFTRLAIGTAGQTLHVAGGAPVWRDTAVASGMTNPLTTTGDIIYSSSGSTAARLGIGSAGQVLRVSGGVPAWTNSSEIAATGSGVSQTASATAITYTTPNDAIAHVYDISAVLNVQAISSATMTVTVVFTNNFTHTSTTNTFFNMGATTAAVSTVSNANFPVMSISADPNTTITVSYTFAGTSITYGYNSRITLLR